jgi:hypothetical protein
MTRLLVMSGAVVLLALALLGASEYLLHGS